MTQETSFAFTRRKTLKAAKAFLSNKGFKHRDDPADEDDLHILVAGDEAKAKKAIRQFLAEYKP